MMSRAQEIFEQAVDLAGPERQAYVARSCAGDPVLLSDVDSLLSAHSMADGFLSDPTLAPHLVAPDASTAASGVTPEQPGAVIDKYTLLSVLGEGGFGHVFLAEQTQPVARKVALKIIRLGCDTAEIVARFAAERQALAMMNHESIARVFDAGATPSGRPYFVMELVEGASITRYCDQHALGVKERLLLFQMVCTAVQHAHQKGMIHRDIKPSNILVAEIDGRAVPKVIDFGIAKAATGTAKPESLLTRRGHFVGTPEYMSPEQASGASEDIDTRADIYALGAVLYELLTGATPFGSDEFRSVDLFEMQRIIREREPVRPSARAAARTTARISAASTTATKRMSSLLRGDLDWITMKCLEKDRERRYDSAQALADDIDRSLTDQPIVAGPPSAAYRFRKFARRHKAATVVLLAVLTGLIGASSGAVVARINMNRAVDAERNVTDVARRLSAAIPQLVAGIAGQPDGSLVKTNAADLMRRTEAWLDANAHRIPSKSQLEMRVNIAAGFLLLGLAAEAPESFSSLEADEASLAIVQIIDVILEQGEMLSTLGRFELAESAYIECLEYLQMRIPDPVRKAEVLLRLAGTEYYQARGDRAEESLKQAVRLIEKHAANDSALLARALGNLADAQATRIRNAGGDDITEQIDMAMRAKALREKIHLDIHSDLARSHMQLAQLMALANRPEARAHLDAALDMTHRLGVQGDNGLLRARVLGLAIYSGGAVSSDANIEHAREARTIINTLVPDGNASTIQIAMTIAMVGAESNLDESIAILRSADETCARHPGWDPAQRVVLKANLIRMLDSTPTPDVQEQLRHAEELVAHERAHCPDHLWRPPSTLTANSGLAMLCDVLIKEASAESLARAERLARECLAARTESEDESREWYMSDAERYVARVLIAQAHCMIGQDNQHNASFFDAVVAEKLAEAAAALDRAREHCARASASKLRPPRSMGNVPSLVAATAERLNGLAARRDQAGAPKP